MSCLSSTQIFLGGAFAGEPSPAAGVRLKAIVPSLGVCYSADSLQRNFNKVCVFAFSGRNHRRTAVAVESYRGEGEKTTDELPLDSSWNDAREKKKVAVKPTRRPERDFAGTPYVPVYVMLPLGAISMKCELDDPDALREQLRVLKSVNVDGVMVDCWWGIVEANGPQKYSWQGYKQLFQMVQELSLKLQGLVGNYASHLIQKSMDGATLALCYDQYLLKSLRKAAEARGHTSWARGPDNAGSYNSRPHDTGFFRDGGDYDSYYGRFFLKWYSQVLVEHGDHVLSLAKLAFEGTSIAAKVSGIHWWYKTASHAAELTGGFYNSCNRDGYAPIAAMLEKHNAALNFTCVELRTSDQNEEFPEALADPEGLVWQVLNAAWDVCIPVASENALPCYDRDGYNKILENAKPLNDPDKRHLSAFTYLRLSPDLMERQNLLEFEHFVKRMHGEVVSELHPEAEEKI